MKDFKFVGFWQRLIMTVFDIMILMGISFLISRFFEIKENAPDLNAKVYLMILNFVALVPAIYTIGFWSIKGATPGKLIRRVKIVDAKTGKIPSLWKVIVRYFCYLISVFFPWLGIFWIATDSRKQTWHDKIAGTVVIKPNVVKIPNDASYDFEFEEQESLIPTSPTNKDLEKWKWGKFLIIFSVISAFLITDLFYGDEKLSPEAAEWLYDPAFIEENPQKNGFYHLIGMFVPEEKDPFQEGYNWVQKCNGYVLEVAKSSQYFKNENELDEIELDIDYMNMFDAFKNGKFIDYCVTNKRNIIRSYNKYSYITDRISLLSNTVYFKNTQIPHFVLHSPILMKLVKFELLENAYIFVLFSEGKTGDALNILSESNRFVRQIADRADTWILYMVSQILLSRNLKMYDLMLKYDNRDLIRKEILELESITISERDVTKITKRDFTEMAHMFINIFNFNQNVFIHNPYFIEKEFVKNSRTIVFKPHKTINEDYLTKMFLAKESKMEAIEFMEHVNNKYLFEPGILEYLNNFMGSILLFVAVPIYEHYIAAFHDIDGYINMLKLKVMILDEKISKKQMPEFLETHSDSLYNPYTQEAFDWDVENSTLYFDGPYENTDDNNMRKVKVEF